MTMLMRLAAFTLACATGAAIITPHLTAAPSGLPSWLVVGACFQAFTIPGTYKAHEIESAYVRIDGDDEDSPRWLNLAALQGVKQKPAAACRGTR